MKCEREDLSLFELQSKTDLLYQPLTITVMRHVEQWQWVAGENKTTQTETCPQKPYCYKHDTRTMQHTCININTKFMLAWMPLSDFRAIDVAEILAVSVSVKSICLIIQPAVRSINDSHCLELSCFLKRICNTQDIYTFRDIGFSDFIHRPSIKKQTKENTTFRKVDLFPSSGEGKTYSVGSLRKS
jgi:hypothetical protein